MKFLLLIATCLFLSNAIAQERRVALVIGNSTYKTSPLPNPVNDSRAMATTLKQLGFDVIERQNLGREDFSKVVREYGERLKGSTVGLFYFAGHGIQVKGRNFLIPVDADIQHEDEVQYRSVDVNEILDKMDTARTAVNLVVLDACRNNPFEHSFKATQAGLAQIDAPTGTLIAFSTAPGSLAQDGEGKNGLYTGALLKHIAAPNLAVEQMFKRVRVDVVAASKNQQVPWESSSLNRDFVFANAAPTLGVTSITPMNVTTPPSDLSLELAFWDEVKRSSNPEDYKAYLEQYPSGRFAALARVRASAVTTVQSSVSALVQATPVVASQVVDSLNAAVVNAQTPEQLYTVQASGGLLQWVDSQRNNTIRATKVYDANNFQPTGLQFSADGRWLLLALKRGAQTFYQLLDVASEKTIWTRAALAAQFDSQAPQIALQVSATQTEMVRLP